MLDSKISGHIRDIPYTGFLCVDHHEELASRTKIIFSVYMDVRQGVSVSRRCYVTVTVTIVTEYWVTCDAVLA